MDSNNVKISSAGKPASVTWLTIPAPNKVAPIQQIGQQIGTTNHSSAANFANRQVHMSNNSERSNNFFVQYAVIKDDILIETLRKRIYEEYTKYYEKNPYAKEITDPTIVKLKESLINQLMHFSNVETSEINREIELFQHCVAPLSYALFYLYIGQNKQLGRQWLSLAEKLNRAGAYLFSHFFGNTDGLRKYLSPQLEPEWKNFLIITKVIPDTNNYTDLISRFTFSAKFYETGIFCNLMADNAVRKKGEYSNLYYLYFRNFHPLPIFYDCEESFLFRNIVKEIIAINPIGEMCSVHKWDQGSSYIITPSLFHTFKSYIVHAFAELLNKYKEPQLVKERCDLVRALHFMFFQHIIIEVSEDIIVEKNKIELLEGLFEYLYPTSHTKPQKFTRDQIAIQAILWLLYMRFCPMHTLIKSGQPEKSLKSILFSRWKETESLNVNSNQNTQRHEAEAAIGGKPSLIKSTNISNPASIAPDLYDRPVIYHWEEFKNPQESDIKNNDDVVMADFPLTTKVITEQRALQHLWAALSFLRKGKGYYLLWQAIKDCNATMKLAAEKMPAEFFEAIAASYNNTKIDKKVQLKTIIKFFQLFTGGHFIEEADVGLWNATGFRQLFERIAANATAGQKLAPELALESAATLLQIKIQEIDAAIANEAALAPVTQMAKALPCLLLAQDGSQALVFFMEAHFSAAGILCGFAADNQQMARNWLTSQISEVTIDERHSVARARLNNEELTTLKARIKEGCEALLLPRQWPPQLGEPIVPVKAVEETPQLIQENEPIGKQEAIEIRQEYIAMETRQRCIVEQQRENRGKKRPAEESVLLSSKEQTIKPKMGPQAKRAKEAKKKTAYQLNKLTSGFVPTAKLIDQQNKFKEARSGTTEGFLPNLVALRSIAGQTEDFSHLPLWQRLTLETVGTIEKKVAWEVQKRKALIDFKPLDYPICQVLENLPAPEPLIFLNPSLKEYQKEAITAILHKLDSFLSTILASEMGLGKTYVLGGVLLHLLARDTTPHKDQASSYCFVITPKSILNSICNDLKKIFCQAKQAAWHYRLANKLEENVLEKFWQAFNEALLVVDKQPQLLESLLPLWSKVALQIKTKSYFKLWNQKNLDVLRGKLVSAQLPEDKKKNLAKASDLWEVLESLGKDYLLFPLVDFALLPPAVLEKICNYDIAGIAICKDKKSFLQTLQKEFPIVLTTSKKFASLAQTTEAFCQIVAIDEAHKAFNPTSDIYKQIADFKKRSSQTKLWAITATPFENNISEMWNLLALTNPDYIKCEAFNILQALFQDCKKLLIDKKKDPEEELVVQLNRCFAQYYVFREQVIRPMAIRQEMKDEMVQQAWPGKVPTRLDSYLVVPVGENLKQKLNKLASDRQFFQATAEVKRLLWLPKGIKSLEKTDEEIQGLLRANDEELLQRLKDVPIFQAFLHSNYISNLIKSGEQALCFVEHKAVARLLQRAIFANFKKGLQIEIFDGDMSDSEREKVLAWFANTAEGSKLLILTKAGGVGLNLWQAKKVFSFATGFNPFAIRQAESRAIRIGHPGEKEVVHIKFVDQQGKAIFFQKHQKSIEKGKNLWSEFFWKADVTPQELLDIFSQILLQSSNHDYLNSERDIDKAKEEKRALQERLQICLSAITEEDLQRTIAQATVPVKSARKVNPSQAQIFNQEQFSQRQLWRLPLPPETSKEEAIKFGTLARLPEYKHKFDNLISIVQTKGADALKEQRYFEVLAELKKVKDSNLPVCIRIFKFENNNYVQKQLEGREENGAVRLYSTSRDTYDLLLKFN